MAWAYPPYSVWDVLRQEFVLNHEVSQPEIQAQIRWLRQNPTYIQKLVQSKPYIYHIITEIKKRHLPGEIALLPMIESTFNPFAYSGAGAAGLWQLMPRTGLDLGLKQDWWYDGRRSIPSSTSAALQHLAYLNRFFHGDWVLAFAAYDAGEGTIARSIRKNHQSSRDHVDFWSLSVPRETRAYIPRLLALAEVIQHASYYHIQLPEIPYQPYFEEVNIGSQIELNRAAKLAGMSYRDLIKLNPGYNRWATAPYRPYKLLIPTNKVEYFNYNLSSLPRNQRVSWIRHKVSAGDSLSTVAAQYHTTVHLIKELNQLKSNTITTGQYVLIPKNKVMAHQSSQQHTPLKRHFTPPKAYKIIYIVDKKDNAHSLEHKFQVSMQQIKQWNNIDPTAPLKVGQNLIIWRSAGHRTYIVKSGDSLSRIAHRHHIPLKHLVRMNPQLNPSKLRLGQVILLA